MLKISMTKTLVLTLMHWVTNTSHETVDCCIWGPSWLKLMLKQFSCENCIFNVYSKMNQQICSLIWHAQNLMTNTSHATVDCCIRGHFWLKFMLKQFSCENCTFIVFQKWTNKYVHSFSMPTKFWTISHSEHAHTNGNNCCIFILC